MDQAGYLREAFRGSRPDPKSIENVFKSISSRAPGSTVTSASSESTTYLGIQLGNEVLLDLRISPVVVEVYASGKLLDALRDLGLPELPEAIGRYSPYIRSVAISKAIPSGTLYLIVQGDDVNVPNIRLVVARDFYDLSSSFCRMSPSESTCALLSRLLELGASYFKEFVGET